MPKFLEEKLKKRYGAKSGVPYAIMNKLGFMHGSKETAKGRAAEKKHASKVKIRGLGGEVKRPATRSRRQGHSFAENMNHRSKY
jgi:hypothetical protein